LREIEEQFAILERIPYRDADLLLSVLGEHIGKELLTVRSGRKIPNRWKSSFLEGSILLGRIMKVKNHHVLTGVIAEKYVPYEQYSPFMILALEMLSKIPSLDRFLIFNSNLYKHDKINIDIMIVKDWLA